MKKRFLIGGVLALLVAGGMAVEWGGCDWFWWDPICWFSGGGMVITDPLFSWSAIGVVFLILLGFTAAIDRYEEDRQRREQAQHEEAMKRARLELVARIGARS